GGSERGEQWWGPDSSPISRRSLLRSSVSAGGVGVGSDGRGSVTGCRSAARVRVCEGVVRTTGTGGVVCWGAKYEATAAGWISASGVDCAIESSAWGDRRPAAPPRESTAKEATSQRARVARTIHGGRACRGRQPGRRQKARRMKKSLLPSVTVKTTQQHRL